MMWQFLSLLHYRLLPNSSRPGWWLVVAACSLVASLAASQQPEIPIDRQVDQLFLKWNRLDSPGAAVAVVSDDKVIYSRGYGSSNPEFRLPITEKTVFHVASVSKQFTVAAILLLEDRDKLTLGDDIRKHLPEVPDFGAKITIRQLIHHTSGLRDQWELLAMAGWRLDDVITTEQILRMVSRQQDLNFTPGSEYLYCNTGYTLLAEIVARISGQTLAEFCRQNFFEPLEMNSTHFHDDHQHLVEDRAYSFSPGPDGGFRKRVLSYATAGATSLFTTAEDLARWALNLQSGAVGGSKLVEQMKWHGFLDNGQPINYGFGLVHGSYRGLKTLSHGGADAGFRSQLLTFPEQKFSVIVLSNVSDSQPGQLARMIADLYLKDRLKEVEASDDRSDRPSPLRYLGAYKLDSGLHATITLREGELFLQADQEAPVELEFREGDRFYIEEIKSEVVFQSNEAGTVTGFRLEREGESVAAQRVFSEEEEAQLTPYEGTYYSPELRILVKLRPSDGILLLEHPRHPNVSLTHVEGERFAGSFWWLRTLIFQRDEENRVTGFSITGSRVRNLRFKRMAGEIFD